MSAPELTFRLSIRSLDHQFATFQWRSLQQVLTVTLDADRFRELGSPGHVEVVLSAFGGAA